LQLQEIMVKFAFVNDKPQTIRRRKKDGDWYNYL